MPAFSVVIFTKNRAAIVGGAVQSVLQQSFRDFEVIISDNDDTDATASALAPLLDDPRVVYHRTNGKLSMADNWETAISLARGEFVLSLTDRSVLKSHALQCLSDAIRTFGEDVYIWQHDYCGETSEEVFRGVRGDPQVVESNELFALFCRSNYEEYECRLPRGLNSCCRQSVLADIRRHAGRVFHPVSPDYTLAFLTLALRRRVVMLNRTLFVWGHGHLSNGGGSTIRSSTFVRFLQDARLSERDLFHHVPVKLLTPHNAICNDLLTLKAAFPELFEVEMDWVSYFVLCRREIEQRLHNDPVAVREWERALADSGLGPLVSERINIGIGRRMWRLVYNSPPARAYRQRKARPRSAPVRFANLLDAARWIEATD